MAGRCRTWLLSLALLLLVPVGVAGAVDPPPPVVEVVVDSDEPDRDHNVAVALGLELGQPVDPVRLRDGVLTLYAAGGLDSVRVEREPAGDGERIVVRLAHTPRVAEVLIVAEGPWRRRARRWLELEPGTLLSVGQVEGGLRRVHRELEERGYADAAVEIDLDYRRADNSVVVTLNLDPGPPRLLAAVATVDVAGQPLPEDVPSFVPGTILTDRVEDRLLRAAEAGLRRRGHWEALVLGARRTPSAAGVALEIQADPGPHYSLELVAPAEDEGMIRASLPNPEEEDLHPAQTELLEDVVRERLQARGRVLAQVRADLVVEAGRRTLRLEVNPDRVRPIAEVAFPGATTVTAEELAGVTAVRPGRVGGWRGQEVTDSTLEIDRLAIVDRLRRAGLADAAVEPARLEATADGGVRVVFEVREGLQWRLEGVSFEGFPVETAAAVERERAALAGSRPWDPRVVNEALRRLETALADTGYPDGRVAVDTDRNDPMHVRVRFVADTGPFVVLGRVVVAGLEQTRPWVVDRVLTSTGVVPGRAWSQQAILEAQRRLYELGLFRRVELLPVPGQERRSTRGLVVRLEEALQRSYLLGIGWDTNNGVRATLGWSHLNVLGGAHAVSAEVRYSGREERFQLGLRELSIPWLDEPGQAVVYRTEEEFSAFSQLRRGLWLEVGDRRRQPWRRWLRYEYQVVRPDAPDEVLSDLEREDQQVRIASLTPSVEWDTRNDLLAPTSGVLASASLEWAFPLFQADAEFVKLLAGVSLYRGGDRGGFAVGVRVGLLRPTADGDGPDNLQTPINSRFFAGGPSTHRAFAMDELGIRGETIDDNGNAIGGTGLLLVNAEYWRRLKGPVSGVVFVDAGNVWADAGSIRLGDVRWGAGLGLRLETPVGPLRAEYGFKLDRERGESTGELHLAFGVPF